METTVLTCKNMQKAEKELDSMVSDVAKFWLWYLECIGPVFMTQQGCQCSSSTPETERENETCFNNTNNLFFNSYGLPSWLAWRKRKMTWKGKKGVYKC